MTLTTLPKVLLYLLAFPILFMLGSCNQDDGGPGQPFVLESAFAGNLKINISGTTTLDVPIDQPIDLRFSQAVDAATVASAISWTRGSTDLIFTNSLLSDGKIVRLFPSNALITNRTYRISISENLKSTNGASIDGIEFEFMTKPGPFLLEEASTGGKVLVENQYTNNVSTTPTISLKFNVPVDTVLLKRESQILGPNPPGIQYAFDNDDRDVTITFDKALQYLTTYTLLLDSDIKGALNEPFSGAAFEFSTEVDTTPKFPIISDEELLTKIQEQTFKYFWDFGHPNSGLARERNTSGNTVTSGGSGFGMMAMIVAVERGFITRPEAVERWNKMLDFLSTCDRFHGAWSHWINGNTGSVIPFSSRDNGGDLVETAFMVQGLITLRQYLNPANPSEAVLRNKINALWEAVEWDWYTKGENEALFWHWSPDQEWTINLRISGHNETQIVYILAAASPTHSIDKNVYTNGYARNGGMQNNQSYLGYPLPLGQAFGGPLFFTHYSYLGLDPRQLEDEYANYWTQNTRHSLINQAYCENNPLGYPGYSDVCWGLTASDNNGGYSAHSPTNDRGVITPTAAISSLPYTPEKSMDAIRHFYYVLGDRLWGEYGFYDAFNPSANWTASSYLAIDQGPIICMIENHRTQLLWDLFMSAPEIQSGLDKLGFTY